MELIIVITILTVLAGAMIPLFNINKAKAENAKATADLAALQTAAVMFHYDVGAWPPEGTAGDTTCLISNTHANCTALAGNANWDGPYIASWQNDPWGNPYAILDGPGTQRNAQAIGPNDTPDNCAVDDTCILLTANDAT